MEKYKTVEEQPDGYRVDGKHLSIEDLRRLQMLMPQTKWIVIAYPRHEDITNPSYLPTADHSTFLKNYAEDPSKFITTTKP